MAIRKGMWMGFWLAALAVCQSVVGLSQIPKIGPSQNSDLQTRARELNQVYRSKAIELLTVYLDPSRFYVEVDVVPKVTGNVDLPYIPKNNLNLGGNPRLMDDVQNLISSVRIVLRLPAELSTQTQQQLSDILFRELPLDRWRGDSVSIRNFHSPQPAKAEVQPAVVAEGPPVAGGASTANLQTRVVKIDDYSLERIWTQAFWHQLSLWHLLALIGVTILAIVAMISALFLARGLAAIGGGLRTVSGSMDKQAPQPAAGSHFRQVADRAKNLHRAALPSERVMHVQTTASIERQVTKMVEKIRTSISLDRAALGCAVELANRYLSSDRESRKAVVLFELIPDQVGQDIYARLGAAQKRNLQAVASAFNAGVDKPQLTLAVGDEFLALSKSRTLSGCESPWSHQIREFLSKTDDHDVARLLPAINADVLPRFIYYLAPQRLAQILAKVRTNDGSFSNRISWALLALPNIEDKLQLDQPIVNLLDAMQEIVRQREAARYFPHLQAVIEGLPPDLRSAISENLVTMSEDFAKFMSSSSTQSANHDDFDPSPHSDLSPDPSNRKSAA